MNVYDFIALVQSGLVLFVVTVILYYIVEFVGVPDPMKKAVQVAIVLLAMLSLLRIVLAPPPHEVTSRGDLTTLPTIPAPPSIIAPERRR